MVKRTEVSNVLDLYPEEMQPPAAGTNGHTPIETTVDDDIIDGDALTAAFHAEVDQQKQEYERIVEKLDQPLDRRLVKQRDGYGIDKRTGQKKMLDYLEHHTVTRAMNRIFGYGRWSQQVVAIHDFFDPAANDGIPRAVRVTVSVHVSAPGFGNYEPMGHLGYCTVTPKQVYKDGRPTGEVLYTWAAYEMALGNAHAKAFKKACAQYGEQFGLSLYGDDDEVTDGEAGEETTTQPRARNQASSDNQRTYDEDESAECEKCGKEIKGYTNRQGKTYTTQQLVEMSRKQSNGRILCLDCRHN